jgi:formamidopyrimidine-DNA glycosylase
MPELPEVEVLVRHLGPLLIGRTIRGLTINRDRVLRPTPARQLKQVLRGASFVDLVRRGKYLVFALRRPARRDSIRLLGHLGMSGRMFLQSADQPAPKHAAVILHLDGSDFVYEDTRYFGRLTLDLSPLAKLGLEPFASEFTADYLARELRRSSQAIKIKLLDQSSVSGLGNIYASEALFRAGISPRVAAQRLGGAQIERLWRAIQSVLREAIEFGSTVPLNWTGSRAAGGLFYYGLAPGAPECAAERLQVYDRAGQPCLRCGRPVRRIVQAARSTFYCPRCQGESNAG